MAPTQEAFEDLEVLGYLRSVLYQDKSCVVASSAGLLCLYLISLTHNASYLRISQPDI